MALIDEVKAVCDRLGGLGWRELLQQVTAGGLDIQQSSAAQLEAALTKPLNAIHRGFPGFSDFASPARQGITPGLPAHSLLYHALASPAVRVNANGPLNGFPTLREIESVENYAFALQAASVPEIRQRAGAMLAVVVFAYEYRPAVDTCSGLQADLVFSRTGISRVGTKEALYNAEHRGFQSEAPDNPFAFNVCPSRFGVFLAVQRKGARDSFTPMRTQGNDATLDFWVPVHKLFDGDECIRGLDLRIGFRSFHYSDKIRRVQVLLGAAPPAEFPFQFSEGIAELRSAPDLPKGILFPTPHPRLVEPAKHNGRLVTFRVPPADSRFAAFAPGSDRVNHAEVRPAPAYVHARTEVRDGAVIDLGNDPANPDVRANVSRGNYDALHYVDFTGEGQLDAVVEGLPASADLRAEVLPAYSLVGAPDFFPSAGQRELSVWSQSAEVPVSLRPSIWGVPPVALCDIRLPANLQMPNNRFSPTETGITALVPMHGPVPAGVRPAPAEDPLRHSCLPDDAAGIFAPGWDVSTDQLSTPAGKTHHLAAYGLGSPFPEDSKLCAALSTFWPTVAPDITRGMSPSTGTKSLRHTVAPLTDEEIGQAGFLPWDGVRGPRMVELNGQRFVECSSFLHVDYVRTALEGRFTSRLTARVTTEEYKRRVLAMAFVYAIVGEDPNRLFVLSFRSLQSGDSELQEAQIDASVIFTGSTYRFELFQMDPSQERVSPTDFRMKLLPLAARRFVLIDPKNRTAVQKLEGDSLWARATVDV